MPITRRDFLIDGSAFALASVAPDAAAREGATRAFRRGGAMHTLMNWGALDERDPTRYLPLPFQAARNAFPDAYVAEFRRAGFDFIRLTLDVGPFLQLTGGAIEALEAKLLANIAHFHALGLDVIVDCHPVEQVHDYSTFAILDDLGAPVFTAYTAMILRLASLLARVDTGRVALELMNEPALETARHGTQIRVWETAQLVLHDAARSVAPGLLLVLTGGHYGGVQGLVDLDPSPFAGSNVRFSFHYYFPIAFTHQGVGNDDPRPDYTPFVVDLPFPAPAPPADRIWRRMEERIKAVDMPAASKAEARATARRLLDDYLADPWDRARIEADIARIVAWADGNAVERSRIILGECGATRRGPDFTGADSGSRNRWFEALRETVEAAGFSWAIWEIGGREFGIQSALDETRLDPEVLRALGVAG